MTLEQEAKSIVEKFEKLDTPQCKDSPIGMFYHDSIECAIIHVEGIIEDIPIIFKKFTKGHPTQVPIEYAEGVVDFKKSLKQHYIDLLEEIKKLKQ